MRREIYKFWFGGGGAALMNKFNNIHIYKIKVFISYAT